MRRSSRSREHVLVACLSALLLTAGCATRPLILSGFGDVRGPEGYPRTDGAHSGVDIGAVVGTPVIAPADGSVVMARDNRDACGLIVVLDHPPLGLGYTTLYCHLSAYVVKAGDPVKRGDVIGKTGNTGLRAGSGFEHVHWELRRGGMHEDPLTKTVGCFDPARQYPNDQLVLTYPVKC